MATKRSMRSWSLHHRLAALSLVLGAFLFFPMSGHALTCDLTTAGSSCDVNGALFQQMSAQPTSSDQIAFVRMGSDDAIVQGYNTSARPVQFDDKTDLVHTHDIRLSQVPLVTIGGVEYRQFGLNINQTGSQPQLSLDRLQVFVSDQGMRSDYPNLGTKIYDLNTAATDNWVKMNAGLNHGSGSGDVWVNVPNALFTGQNPYVYVYSEFGAHLSNNGGYEQWFLNGSVSGGVAQTPEPASLLLLGSGLAGLGAWRRRRV